MQSEIQLRKYRESLGLADPTGATGAVIPLNEVRLNQLPVCHYEGMLVARDWCRHMLGPRA